MNTKARNQDCPGTSDGNHQGVEGCDYSIVESSDAVPQASPAVRNPIPASHCLNPSCAG